MSETCPHAGARPLRKHTAVLRDWLPTAGWRLADIGCGGGALARRLAGAGAWVIGLDPQAEAFAVARRARGNGPGGDGTACPDYVAAVGEALPLADGCLDAAVYFNALHHVPMDSQDDALAECRRVLVPGGRLVVVEPLAEGPVFEMLRPIEDETMVRAAACAALARAVADGGWRLLHEMEYDAPVRYESFAAFRDSVIAVDPARRAAVARHEADMRSCFAEVARQADGAFRLDQPSRLTVLVACGG